jgi:prefoldin subunit 5
MDPNKIKEIINDPKNQSNIDLMECMDFLSNEHEELKNTILKLTYHLDEVEFSYNKILEEFKNITKEWMM